tara:strand:- start:13170 stop:13454 length:285 start_codon:yes stop_codon:yes gene_type:complete
VTYQALPDGLFVSDSPIAGQGIFTRKPLKVGTELGISHILDGKDMYRTPLGGFINHSELPNCEKYRVGMKYYVKVISPIEPMEELTLKYTFYKV